jgi:hypothetical protein
MSWWMERVKYFNIFCQRGVVIKHEKWCVACYTSNTPAFMMLSAIFPFAETSLAITG